jgi:hypothetical protein
LIATQSWVCPQQVTVPTALEQVPAATVQDSVDPPEQVAVQVWVADAILGPPHAATSTTVISPIITRALRMLPSSFRVQWAQQDQLVAGRGPQSDRQRWKPSVQSVRQGSRTVQRLLQMLYSALHSFRQAL